MSAPIAYCILVGVHTVGITSANNKEGSLLHMVMAAVWLLFATVATVMP